MDYTLFKADGKDAGGMMKVPQPGMPAQWLPYVVVENVDAAAAKVAELGGQVMASFRHPDHWSHRSAH